MQIALLLTNQILYYFYLEADFMQSPTSACQSDIHQLKPKLLNWWAQATRDHAVSLLGAWAGKYLTQSETNSRLTLPTAEAAQGSADFY